MVKILDCTTRDGGHQTNWEFDDEYVYDLITRLNQQGVTYYEIGYRNFKEKEGKGRFFCCSPEFLKRFQYKKGNLKIGIMVDCSRFSYKDFPGKNKDYTDFVRIACHPDKIEQTINIANELFVIGYKIFIQLMEIPNVKEKEYKILENWGNKDILESLYIADSYSTVRPEQLKVFFNRLRIAGYENISFHAHNKSGYALENTIEAMKLGAYSIDITQNGLGENLNSEEFFKFFNN